jgi:hypothetical protein
VREGAHHILQEWLVMEEREDKKGAMRRGEDTYESVQKGLVHYCLAHLDLSV